MPKCDPFTSLQNIVRKDCRDGGVMIYTKHVNVTG